METNLCIRESITKSFFPRAPSSLTTTPMFAKHLFMNILQLFMSELTMSCPTPKVQGKCRNNKWQCMETIRHSMDPRTRPHESPRTKGPIALLACTYNKLTLLDIRLAGGYWLDARLYSTYNIHMYNLWSLAELQNIYRKLYTCEAWRLLTGRQAYKQKELPIYPHPPLEWRLGSQN